MKKVILHATAVYFAITALLVIYLTISEGRPAHVLWFCYTGLLIMSIAIWLNKGWIVASQLNLIAIPLIVWKLDYFYHLFTGVSLFGAIDYFFVGEDIITKLIVIQHAITLPLGLVILFLLKIEKSYAWIWSIIQAIIIFILVRVFTTPEFNINCVYYFCSPLIQIPPTVYPFLWISVLSGVIYSVNRLLLKLFGANIFKDSKRTKKPMNKRGVSPIIATMLLVVFAILVGVGVMSWASSISAALPPITCDNVEVQVRSGETDICVSDTEIRLLIENGAKVISGVRVSYVSDVSGHSDYLQTIAEGVIKDIRILYNLEEQGHPERVYMLPFIDTERGRLYCTEQSEQYLTIPTCP